MKKLREPMPLKWRVQTTYADKAIMSSYVDARDVQDHLDNVVGPNNWRNEYKEINGKLFCGISILVGEDWVTKWDVGTPSKIDSDKGHASDAFKRAAVHWGINRAAYQVRAVTLNCKKEGKKITLFDNKGNKLFGDALNDYCNSISDFDDVVIEYNDTITDEDVKAKIESFNTFTALKDYWGKLSESRQNKFKNLFAEQKEAIKLSKKLAS